MFSGKYHTEHGIYTVKIRSGKKKNKKNNSNCYKSNLDLDFRYSEMLKDLGYVNGHFANGIWEISVFIQKIAFDVNIEAHMEDLTYFSPYKYTNMDDGPKGEYLTDRIGDEVVNAEDNTENNFSHMFLFSLFTHQYNPNLIIKKIQK